MLGCLDGDSRRLSPFAPLIERPYTAIDVLNGLASSLSQAQRCRADEHEGSSIDRRSHGTCRGTASNVQFPVARQSRRKRFRSSRNSFPRDGSFSTIAFSEEPTTTA